MVLINCQEMDFIELFKGDQAVFEIGCTTNRLHGEINLGSMPNLDVKKMTF